MKPTAFPNSRNLGSGDYNRLNSKLYLSSRQVAKKLRANDLGTSLRPLFCSAPAPVTPQKSAEMMHTFSNLRLLPNKALGFVPPCARKCVGGGEGSTATTSHTNATTKTLALTKGLIGLDSGMRSTRLLVDQPLPTHCNYQVASFAFIYLNEHRWTPLSYMSINATDAHIQCLEDHPCLLYSFRPEAAV